MPDGVLFDMDPEPAAPAAAPEPAERLSADRRRTLRQRADAEAGRHPLTGGALLTGPSLTCGDCRWRRVLPYGNRSYPKCLWRRATGTYPPRMTHGAASDVRAWWPACTDYASAARRG